MIELTNEAIQRILALQELQKFNHIRVGVTGGGCAGFEYVFDGAMSPNPHDSIIDYGKFSTKNRTVTLRIWREPSKFDQ